MYILNLRFIVVAILIFILLECVVKKNKNQIFINVALSLTIAYTVCILWNYFMWVEPFTSTKFCCGIKLTDGGGLRDNETSKPYKVVSSTSHPVMLKEKKMNVDLQDIGGIIKQDQNEKLRDQQVNSALHHHIVPLDEKNQLDHTHLDKIYM